MTDEYPDRGDIAWLDLDPQAGHEQAGRRPVLVLSPRAYNAGRSLMIACPITNHVKGYVFEVAIPEGHGVSGVILADHVRSYDWRARRAERLSRLPRSVVAEVATVIAALIGLDP